MTLTERLFSGAVAATRPLLPALGLVSPELGRAAAERRGVVSRLRAWSAASGESEPPTVWLHGASAGELTGAAATVRELRRRTPVRLLVTYFSPSAEPVLGRLAPDGAEVLPLDTRPETRRALEAVQPDVLVFAKHDLWPNLTASSAELGVPMALVNGAVRAGSSRLRAPGRWLLGPAYGRLDRAGAASRADAERLARLGVPEAALTVTGDASFDWALERARRAASDPDSPARRLERMLEGSGPVVVAGSTWPDDEEALVRSVRRLARNGRGVRLALVPHEPEPARVEDLARLCRDVLGRRPRLWTEADGSGPGEFAAARDEHGGRDGSGSRTVIVDVVGVLADLYAAADIAYVGGGLGGTGLHSVVEPAAAGVPVLFGAGSDRREARLLEERGGGRAVEDTGDLVGALGELTVDERRRETAGRAARRALEAEAGAAGAGADLLVELLEQTR